MSLDASHFCQACLFHISWHCLDPRQNVAIILCLTLLGNLTRCRCLQVTVNGSTAKLVETPYALRSQ